MSDETEGSLLTLARLASHLETASYRLAAVQAGHI